MRLLRFAAAASLGLACVLPGTARAADGLEVDFGLGRRPLTRTFYLTMEGGADAAVVENPSVRLASDLRGDTGQFPLSQVTLSAVAAGGQLVQLTAVVDPLEPEPVDAGTYDGEVLVSADGFSTVEVDVLVRLEDRTNWVHVSWVVGVLLAGGAFGTAAKWLNDTGLLLYPLRRRYQTLDKRLYGTVRYLPKQYDALRKNALDAIRTGDVASAKQHVNALQRYADQAMALGEKVRVLDLTNKRHRAYVRDLGITHGAFVTQVHQILGYEEEAIRGLSRARLADLRTALAGVPEIAARFHLIGDVLGSLDATEDRPKVRKVVRLLCAREFTKALAEWDKIGEETRYDWGRAGVAPVAAEPATEPADEASGEEQATPRQATRRRRPNVKRWWQDFVVDHVRFLVAACVVALTTLVGFTQKFLDDPSFTGRTTQYVGLFFFAAAVPLGGIQIAQLLGRAWSGPMPATAAETPPEPVPEPVTEGPAPEPVEEDPTDGE